MPVHIHAWQQVGMGCLSYSCVALEEPSPISCHLVPFLPRIRLSVSSPVRVPETQAALLRYAVLPGQKQHSTTRTYTGTRCAHQHHDKQCINTTTSSALKVLSAKASPRHKNKHVIAAAPFKRATVECAAIDRI